MTSSFQDKLNQIEHGRNAFISRFNGIELTNRDRFVLVLTCDPECISSGIRHFTRFAASTKGNVYVIYHDCDRILEFEQAGAHVIRCNSEQELDDIAVYLSIYGEFDVSITVTFLTEKDTYGARAENLIKSGEVDLDKYVEYGIYSLEKESITQA